MDHNGPSLSSESSETVRRHRGSDEPAAEGHSDSQWRTAAGLTDTSAPRRQRRDDAGAAGAQRGETAATSSRELCVVLLEPAAVSRCSLRFSSAIDRGQGAVGRPVRHGR